jgi:hypothetical protein
MTKENEKLALDEDGIPILMDIVRDSGPPMRTQQDTGDHMASLSADEIADELLENEMFQHQLNEVAAVLTRNVRQLAEKSLKPAIEQAIQQALDNSSGNSFNAIREQLETSLPELLAKSISSNNTQNKQT